VVRWKCLQFLTGLKRFWQNIFFRKVARTVRHDYYLVFTKQLVRLDARIHPSRSPDSILTPASSTTSPSPLPNLVDYDQITVHNK